MYMYVSCFREETLETMRPIPIGGDQLTCERIRGAHMAVYDLDTPEERLEGLFCMIEDFHEKMNYLEVSYTFCTLVSILQCHY